MSMITELFARSPVRPMQKHMSAAVTCAREMVPLIEAMCEGDLDKIAICRTQIDDLEHKADELKHDIRGHLPKRLFMAMERRDMLEILDYQDSIADRVQDMAELAAMRGMTLPDAMRDPVRDLARTVVITCEMAETVVNELDELVETGFRGREVERVEDMIRELGAFETEADRAGEVALQALFSIEKELGVGTFFWYQWLGWAEEVANLAEKVGNRLRLLIAN
jgi:predicted phosphate transport protein (TIGR00153 family)